MFTENNLLSRGPANLTINSFRPDISVTWCFDSILKEKEYFYKRIRKIK